MTDPEIVHEEEHEASHGITWTFTVYQHPPITSDCPYLSSHVTVRIPFVSGSAYQATYQVLTDGLKWWGDGAKDRLIERTRAHAERIIVAIEAAVALGRSEVEHERELEEVGA